MTLRSADILIDGTHAGRLVETPNGSAFTYDSAYLNRDTPSPPVSVTMPLRAEPYESTGLLPYFENLLPEGWLLELSTRKLKIPKDDVFGLLLATCSDCVGAVEVVARAIQVDGAAPKSIDSTGDVFGESS